MKMHKPFKMWANTDEEAKKLANQRLEELLTPVKTNWVISTDKNFVYLNGERADQGRLANLRSEAEFLLNSDIWKVIHETPKELAMRTMFIHSESLDDMKKGKSVLFTLSQQKNIIDTLLSVKVVDK